MKGKKVCVDIGGTKTIFAVLDGRLKIKKSIYIETPRSRKRFMQALSENLAALEPQSDTVNVSIAGRIDKTGHVLFCPNLPITGVNLRAAVRKHFKNVYIDNDANCFAMYEIFRGALRNRDNGVIIVWGTGIGGALILYRKIYRGAGLASEMGHIKIMVEPRRDVERLIGGAWVQENFSHSGLELHRMAERGDSEALADFQRMGEIFGRYLSSLAYLLDPEIVVIGGSFVKSWRFIKNAAINEIKSDTIRKKLKIKTVGGKFYVIKGCYFLDEYEKLNNKL